MERHLFWLVQRFGYNPTFDTQKRDPSLRSGLMRDMYPIKLYIKHLPNLIMLPLGLLLNLASWVWLLSQIKPQTDPIFLHYNILFGVDYIGDWWKVLYLPIAGLFIYLINTILSWVLFGKDKFAAQLLNFVSIFCQVFVLIAAALLVFLNV